MQGEHHDKETDTTVAVQKRGSHEMSAKRSSKIKTISKLTSELNLAKCHEDIWGKGGIPPLFLNLVPDRDEWSFHRPAALPLEKQTPEPNE